MNCWSLFSIGSGSYSVIRNGQLITDILKLRNKNFDSLKWFDFFNTISNIFLRLLFGTPKTVANNKTILVVVSSSSALSIIWFISDDYRLIASELSKLLSYFVQKTISISIKWWGWLNGKGRNGYISPSVPRTIIAHLILAVSVGLTDQKWNEWTTRALVFTYKMPTPLIAHAHRVLPFSPYTAHQSQIPTDSIRYSQFTCKFSNLTYIKSPS